MRISTWNVNSVNARLPLVLEWLQETRPDIVLLQELKCQDSSFPAEPLFDLGYNCATLGQKTYNGVAILSRHPLEDVRRGIDGETSGHARYIEAFTGGVRVGSVYVPNGQSLESPAYETKLNFFVHLTNHVKKCLHPKEAFVLGGDFNVAPTDRDVFDPVKWEGQVLVSEPERQAFKTLLDTGLTDALGNRKEPPYTWWDYRAGSWGRDHGLRIDHLLCSESVVVSDVGVDRFMRGRPRPSDHAPVWCKISSS